MKLGDLCLKLGLQGAVADDPAVEAEATISQQGAGLNEIGVAFFLDQATDAEDAAA